jgi:hypothetical protein
MFALQPLRVRTTHLNCSLISRTNQHCNLANDLIDVNSSITLTTVVGVGFESASERLKTREFSANYHDVKFIPCNLADFFPNLEIIAINHAKLSEIRENDLAQFSNLLEIDFSNNNIRKIGRNLFKFNDKLREIRMDDNPIGEIHPMAFASLKNLVKIKLGKVYYDWTIDETEKIEESENLWNFYAIFAVGSGFLNVWLLSVICGVFWRRKGSKLRKENEGRRKLSETSSNFTESLNDMRNSEDNFGRKSNFWRSRNDSEQKRRRKMQRKEKYKQKRSKTEPILYKNGNFWSTSNEEANLADPNSINGPNLPNPTASVELEGMKCHQIIKF